MSAAQHQDAAVRAIALSALGTIRDKAAFERLQAALDDPSAECRAAAAKSLGKQGNLEIIGHLLPALRAEKDPATRVEMMGSLGALRAKDAAKALAGYADDEDYLIANAAVRGLAAIGEPASRYLTKLLKTGNDNRLSIIVDALRSFNGPWAVDLLATVAGDEDDHASYWATISLGETRSSKAIAPLTATLKQKRHMNAAIWALGNLGTEKAKSVLEKALLRDEYASEHPNIKQALGQFE